MVKIKLSSVLELSKFLSTQSGKELRDILEYLSQLSQQVITALTSNLSYGDNFDCEIKNIQVKSNSFTTIAPSKAIPIREVRIRRVYDNIFYIVDYSGWNIDQNGNINFLAKFIASPVIDYQPVESVPAVAVGAVITVTSPQHGLATGYLLYVYNASGFTTSNNVNGIVNITVLTADTFVFNAPGGAPAAGPGTIDYQVKETGLERVIPSNYLVNLDIIIYYG